MSADHLRTLLFGFMAVMPVLAWLSLARRQLAWSDALAYGLLALGLPILGAFLVIAFPPRKRRAELRKRGVLVRPPKQAI